MAGVGASVGKVRSVLTAGAEDGARREDVSPLDDVVGKGARRMLTATLEAEVDAYLAERAGERDERGRLLVVRNGHAQPREEMTAADTVQVRAPRVDDNRFDVESGQRKRLRCTIPPPRCRKSPEVAEVLPLLYLHGLPTGDVGPAPEGFLGSAAGLSSATVTNVPSALPESAHPRPKTALAEICDAADEWQAQAAARAFTDLHGANFLKATLKTTDDLGVLLSFYDYPAGHRTHLRTTNPIESTFTTIQHQTRVTKGPVSRAAELGMAFKLIESAQWWRAVYALHLVALVRAGARFDRCHLAERSEAVAA